MAANEGKKPQKPSSKANSDEVDRAHIPVSLRDPVLTMMTDTAFVGNIPTIFVGIVDQDYTESMWTNHSGRISHLFGIDQPQFVREIKVRNRGENQIDAKQLELDVNAAIELLNINVVPTIRIVGLGIHGASAVYEELESLVRGWNLSWEEKKVQFVALGDSQESVYLNFCKAVCLKKICRTIQFYSTMDYNRFGFLELENKHHAHCSHAHP
jgi:hypothetical protein